MPDQLIYNGFIPIDLKELSKQEIKKYSVQFDSFPKVIVYRKRIFFLNKNVRKAKEMEEVFKYHLLSLRNCKGKASYLRSDDNEFLSASESEKYRQNL